MFEIGSHRVGQTVIKRFWVVNNDVWEQLRQSQKSPRNRSWKRKTKIEVECPLIQVNEIISRRKWQTEEKIGSYEKKNRRVINSTQRRTIVVGLSFRELLAGSWFMNTVYVSMIWDVKLHNHAFQSKMESSRN